MTTDLNALNAKVQADKGANASVKAWINAATAILEPAPPVSVNPVPPPATGAAILAYIEGVTTYGKYFPAKAPWSNAPIVDPGTSDPWPQFETDAGKKLWGLMFGESGFFVNPGDYDGNFAVVKARGAVPVVDVQTQSSTSSPAPLGTLADIAAGKYDAQLATIGKGAAGLGPFVLRIDAEMNGGWYPFGAEIRATPQGPANFIAAWRKIVTVFRANGAANISYHWCPNVDPDSIQTPLESLYPGDSYVDWAGMTGYNGGNQTAEYIFGSTYKRLVALTSKPIMIGETGSVDVGFTPAGQKAQFISDLFAKLPTEWPQVRALCWFNWYNADGTNPPEDWPIESSAASQAAFQEAAKSSYIVGR